MLYYLFEYLDNCCDVPGAGMFTYVTFRAIFAVICSLLISIFFGKYFINKMKKNKIYETQRDEKTDPFNTQKVGVPTMGGIIIITAILIPCLLIGKVKNVYMILMMITTVLLGIVGFADDYIKTFKKNKDGLNGWYKITAQVLLGLMVGLTLRFSPAVVMNEKVDTKIVDNKEIVVKTPAHYLLDTSNPSLVDAHRLSVGNVALPTNWNTDGIETSLLHG